MFIKKTDDCGDACLISLIMSCFCLVITAANIKFTIRERKTASSGLHFFGVIWIKLQVTRSSKALFRQVSFD